MKRWHLVRIIGAGTEADPQRWAVAHVPNLSIEFGSIPTDPVTGLVTQAWSLCLVSDEDVATISKHDDVVPDALLPLPDVAADEKMADVDSAVKTQLTSALAEKFATAKEHDEASALLEAQSVIQSAENYRDLLDTLGKKCDPAFRIDKYAGHV